MSIEMMIAANNLEYEKAALLRDQIAELKAGTGIDKIEPKRRPVSYSGEERQPSEGAGLDHAACRANFACARRPRVSLRIAQDAIAVRSSGQRGHRKRRATSARHPSQFDCRRILPVGSLVTDRLASSAGRSQLSALAFQSSMSQSPADLKPAAESVFTIRLRGASM